jgi:hypothetical protein
LPSESVNECKYVNPEVKLNGAGLANEERANVYDFVPPAAKLEIVAL